MKVLFIGGTGIISSACSELAIQKGIELYHYNRGQSLRKIDGVKQIRGDIRDFESTKAILSKYDFDVVVDFIAFVPEHIINDIKLFNGKVSQFIFISSASAYQKPVRKLPITENTPLENPFWQYSRDKIECEKILFDEYKKNKFPVTIVRPSHTYDKTLIPIDWGYTTLKRMKEGKKTIIHGDGTSLWVLTHHKDFAVGFIGLLGKKEAIGEAFHITGDELLPWNQIYEMLAYELKVELKPVHIPSEVIAKFDERMGASLLGDKAHSVIFDNTKIKTLVPEFKQKIPFSEGVKEIVQFYEKNPASQKYDPIIDETIDKIIEKYGG
ncbi:MAG: NAD-dependent epimerase/dehydratase family protein [Brevinematales bacterium]|nr:NAD-dependent epimerase/dehydratase family protein [Brevinematales bacterium]